MRSNCTRRKSREWASGRAIHLERKEHDRYNFHNSRSEYDTDSSNDDDYDEEGGGIYEEEVISGYDSGYEITITTLSSDVQLQV